MIYDWLAMKHGRKEALIKWTMVNIVRKAYGMYMAYKFNTYTPLYVVLPLRVLIAPCCIQPALFDVLLAFHYDVDK
jgi:hypothetical protein